jgi:multicomponent Na+:H+ antiporter subunit B
MNTLIFRTIAPVITVVMLVFSVFVTLRGHNDPGGGFIGGLIAASAVAIYGIAFGVGDTRRAMKFDPLALAGFGVALAGLSGLLSLSYELPYLTGLWTDIGGVAISTPMVFDLGVYFTVFGTISAIALALEGDGEDE